MTQNNLGNVLLNLGEREGDPKQLAAAVAAYRSALEVYTREASPAAWAMTQNNLGFAFVALSKLSNRNRNLQTAMEHLRLAESGYRQTGDLRRAGFLAEKIREIEKQLMDGGLR
jgi:hypothetical protein